MSDIQREIDENYEEFSKLLPQIIHQNRDRYALMKGRKILGYFSSSTDARAAARAFISDNLYSIQRVTDSSIDLGYFSHAVPLNSLQS